MAKQDFMSNFDAIELTGVSEVVGTPTVTVIEQDSSQKVYRAKGATVPTAGDAGYAKGCEFIKTGGAAGDTLYINIGSATSADFRVFQPNSSVINATASTLTVTQATHGGATVTLNRAAGIAVTLPAATGTGTKYRFVVGTTITSNTTTISVANATDYFVGMATLLQDAADTIVGFATANTGTVATESDRLTMDGSTQGGIKGAIIEIEDIATAQFSVRYISDASGTEATPFSAAV